MDDRAIDFTFIQRWPTDGANSWERNGQKVEKIAINFQSKTEFHGRKESLEYWVRKNS